MGNWIFISKEQGKEQKQSSERGALILMGGTLASRITGLLRNTLLIKFFPSHLSDAFWIAWKIPNLFRELLAEGALINSFIPVYNQLSKEDAKRLSSTLLFWLSCINILLLLLAVWAAPVLVKLLIAEGSSLSIPLTISLTRLIFPVLMAISFSALAMGLLNAEERFFAPAWAPVALNVVVILMMVLFQGNITLLTLGVVIGGFVQLLVQVPALIKNKIMPRITHHSMWHPELLTVLVLMIPFAFTTGARQLLNILSTRLLSGMPVGSITAYENANLILSLALGLFSVSPAIAFYSRLSSNAANEPERFPKTLLSGLRFIAFLTVPVSCLVFLLSPEIINMIWDWGVASGQEKTLNFSIVALFPLAFAIVPMGLSNLLIRPFYIRKRIRPPILVSMLFVGLTGFLYYLLAPTYGIASLSWATAAVATLQMAILIIWLKRDEKLDSTNLLSLLLKLVAAGASAAAVTSIVLRFIPFFPTQLGVFLKLCVGGGLFAGLYLALCFLLKIPELQQFLGRFSKRFAK